MGQERPEVPIEDERGQRFHRENIDKIRETRAYIERTREIGGYTDKIRETRAYIDRIREVRG